MLYKLTTALEAEDDGAAAQQQVRQIIVQALQGAPGELVKACAGEVVGRNVGESPVVEDYGGAAGSDVKAIQAKAVIEAQVAAFDVECALCVIERQIDDPHAGVGGFAENGEVDESRQIIPKPLGEAEIALHFPVTEIGYGAEIAGAVVDDGDRAAGPEYMTDAGHGPADIFLVATQEIEHGVAFEQQR